MPKTLASLTQRRKLPMAHFASREIRSCDICSEDIGVSRADKTVEKAFTLPCGHTFGSACILRWLQDSIRQDCPNCRRRMVHQECGHLIMPHEVSTAPPAIREEEMPPRCLRCRGEEIVSVALKAEHARMLAAERSLRSLQIRLPKIFGSMSTISLLNIDKRIEDLREGFALYHERAWRDYEENERRLRW